MSKFAKLRITSDGPLGKHATVEVNGQDLSSCVRSICVDFTPGSIITAHLELLVDDLELEGPGIVEIERTEEECTDKATY